MNKKERLDKVEESVIRYMKTHWPSEVRPEWRVADGEYVEILERVLESFTKGEDFLEFVDKAEAVRLRSCYRRWSSGLNLGTLDLF